MIIGIDIDNTISNTRETILSAAVQFNEANQRPNQFDSSYYNLEKSLGWDSPTTQLFLETHLTDIYRQVQPKPHAVEVIRQLHKLHRIILITSRNQRNEEITAITLDWLQKYAIAYDKLVMNQTENPHHFSKLSDCLENGVELMIEDHHDLAKELSQYFPVILFDYPYNMRLIGDNIIRVQSWLAVREAVQEMGEKLPKAAQP